MSVYLGHTGYYLIMSVSSICQSYTHWREGDGQIRLAIKTRLMNDKQRSRDEGENQPLRVE